MLRAWFRFGVVVMAVLLGAAIIGMITDTAEGSAWRLFIGN